jgi:hypothetical protein
MNVVSVAPHPNAEKNWRHVTLDENGNRQRAVCFAGAAADELKPGPLPPDWRVKQGEHGPILEPPRSPGALSEGAAGFATRKPASASSRTVSTAVSRRSSRPAPAVSTGRRRR